MGSQDGVRKERVKHSRGAEKSVQEDHCTALLHQKLSARPRDIEGDLPVGAPFLPALSVNI